MYIATHKDQKEDCILCTVLVNLLSIGCIVYVDPRYCQKSICMCLITALQQYYFLCCINVWCDLGNNTINHCQHVPSDCILVREHLCIEKKTRSIEKCKNAIFIKFLVTAAFFATFSFFQDVIFGQCGRTRSGTYLCFRHKMSPLLRLRKKLISITWLDLSEYTYMHYYNAFSQQLDNSIPVILKHALFV